MESNYHVGDKLKVRLKCGFHHSEEKVFDVEVISILNNISNHFITMRVFYPSGGYRDKYVYEKDLDELVET